jgi:hypothetical protein
MMRSPMQVVRLLMAFALVLSGATAVRADLDTYVFEGVIQEADVGTLFGSKLPGQTFDGSFTLDTTATLTAIGDSGNYTTWSGGFAVVVEGVSHPVVNVAVWSSGPGGAADGFELAYMVDGETGYVSLRSSSDIYTLAAVPTTVDLADMDEIANVRIASDFPVPASDEGQLTFLPEPECASLGIAAAATVACLRVRSRR